MDGSVLLPGGGEQLGRTMRPAQLAALVRRNAGIILLCTALGAALAFGFAKSQTPHYSAYGSIALEGQTFAIPELQGAVNSEAKPDPMPLVRTEVQVLQSRQLVQSVIAKLGIDRLAEFNPALQGPSLVSVVKQRLLDLFPLLPMQPGRADGSEQAVLDKVLQALVVSQDNRSLVIGVSFTAEDPQVAADFVNELIDGYLALQTQRRASANQSANAEMLHRVDAVRLELTRLEKQMRDLRTTGELVGLRAGSVGQQQLEDLATAASRASLERTQLEAQWRRADALLRQGASGDLDSVLASPTIGKLREQESQASQHLADLQAHYGPNYPGVRSAQANLQAAASQVAGESQRIVASLSAQLSVARAREADTKQQLQGARDAGVKSENAQAGLNDLQQEVTAQRALYQSLLQGAQRTVAQSGGATTPLDVRVINSAMAPSQPSSPNPRLALGMGGLGGGVLGLLLVLLRVRSVDALWSAADVFAATGLPVVTLPLRLHGRQTLLSKVRRRPDGEEAKALHLLWVRLHAAGNAGAPGSVLFTSFDDDAGTAMVATAFAYAVAGQSEKVILVEGNFQAPHLAKLLHVTPPVAWPSSQGEAEWRDSLLTDRAAGLDLLVADRAVTPPNRLPGKAYFQNLLIDLHKSYALTVLNGPAAGPADTADLVTEANAVVLILRAGKIRRVAVQEMASRLASATRNRVEVALLTGS